MLGELIPCGGGDSIPLLKAELLVGRRSRCDIVLQFPNVSSHHCTLELLDGYWHVRDLGSRNGIKVNGERCDSKWLLPGDELSIARHAYEVSYTPATDAPPPEEENPFQLGLLEKAGLGGRRTERGSPRARPKPAKPEPPPAVPPQPAAGRSNSDDDLALQFLNEDGDE